jgi:hypothetical protein
MAPEHLLGVEREHLMRLRLRGAFVVRGAFRTRTTGKALCDRVIGRLIGMGLVGTAEGDFGIVRVTLTKKGDDFARVLAPARQPT